MHRFYMMAAIIVIFCGGFLRSAAAEASVEEASVERPDDAEIVKWMRQMAALSESEKDSRLEAIVRRSEEGTGATPRSDFLTCTAMAYWGSAKAQYCAGRAYETATGVVEDLLDAYVWYALSANSGFPSAEAARERVKTLLLSVYPAPSDDDLNSQLAARQKSISRYREEAKQ